MALTVAPAQSATITAMASITGTCERLVMAGDDMSEHCDSKILQSIYDSGRTGWTIAVGDKGTMFTFSGMEGAKPDQNSQLQSVDGIILNLGIAGVDPTSQAVQGGCAYSNPYLGQMTISCQAADADGKAYLLIFRTDGSEPQFTDLQGAKKAAGPSGAQQTAVGPWLIEPFSEGEVRGCLMSMEINARIMLMVYADGNETFDISIFNENWHFEPGAQIEGELLFDGTTYPFTTVSVRNENVLTLHGAGEEEGYELFFKQAGELVFKMDGQQVTAKLTGSAAATEKLWDCVGS